MDDRNKPFMDFIIAKNPCMANGHNFYEEKEKLWFHSPFFFIKNVVENKL